MRRAWGRRSSQRQCSHHHCEEGGAIGEGIETDLEEWDPIEDGGERGSKGGGVKGMDFKVASKGELDGEFGKRVSMVEILVNACGAVETMDTVGRGELSIKTQRSMGTPGGRGRGREGIVNTDRLPQDG